MFTIRKKHVKSALIELGDRELREKFFRKAYFQSNTWTRRLLLAATVSLVFALPVFLFSQSQQFKSFQRYATALSVAGQTASGTRDDRNKVPRPSGGR
jgi:hypothetical protein